MSMRADEVEIGHPCPIDLREHVARASGESFQCDHCDRPVHVLSHMSEADAEAVLARREREHLCVAFLRAPDGSVQFREADEVLVPAGRLRRIVRASALALSMAACDGEEKPNAFEVVEQPQVAPPLAQIPPAADPVTKVETDEEQLEEHLEVLGGPPPVKPRKWDQPVAEVDGELHVRFELLRPRRTPEPTLDAVLKAKIAEREELPEHRITIGFCVDEEGQVVDAKRGRGDPQAAKLYIRWMAKWRFVPYEVDGRKVRVCSEKEFRIPFDPPA